MKTVYLIRDAKTNEYWSRFTTEAYDEYDFDRLYSASVCEYDTVKEAEESIEEILIENVSSETQYLQIVKAYR